MSAQKLWKITSNCHFRGDKCYGEKISNVHHVQYSIRFKQKKHTQKQRGQKSKAIANRNDGCVRVLCITQSIHILYEIENLKSKRKLIGKCYLKNLVIELCKNSITSKCILFMSIDQNRINKQQQQNGVVFVYRQCFESSYFFFQLYSLLFISTPSLSLIPCSNRIQLVFV